MAMKEAWRKRLEVAGFVAFVAWILFAGWCATQNAERDRVRRESCTCGALTKGD